MSTESADFGSQVERFLINLHLEHPLPQGVDVLQPYANPEVRKVVHEMCRQYYSGAHPRIPLWGINPGRFGAGLTGLAFTDPTAVKQTLRIQTALDGRRELSAEFMASVIEAYGGPKPFYRDVYMTALSPLGFVSGNKNLNFYDSRELQESLTGQIQSWVRKQCAFELRKGVTIVVGTGKLKDFFERHIRTQCGFDTVVYLEHPRYIMQYKRSEIDTYRQKYINAIQYCTNV